MAIDIVLTTVIVGSALGGGASALLAAIAWRNRHAPASFSYGLLSMAMAVWAIGYGGTLGITAATAAQPNELRVAYTFVQVAAAQVPPLWIVFTLRYTGREKWLTPWTIGALWIEPIAYAVVVLTAPYHGLASSTLAMVTINGITAPVFVTGVAFHLHLAAAYLLIVVGYLVLASFSVRSRSVYRNQTTALVIASLFPVVGNGLFHLGYTPHPGIDITPALFVVTGGISGWTLFKHNFLDVTPLASDLLVDELPDPVLVLDDRDLVVDHNAAAQSAFGVKSLTGRPIDDVAPGFVTRARSEQLITSLPPDAEERVAAYSPHVRPIEDQHGVYRGLLVVLRDVSVQQRRLDRVTGLQATTQQFMEARLADDIASAAVEFVDHTLDHSIAVVFLADDQRLRPVATSDGIPECTDDALPDVTPGDPLWDAFEDQTDRTVTDPPEWCTLDADIVEQLLAVSLGEHGLLCIGTSETDENADADRQFVKLVAGTARTALERVRREQELRERRQDIRQQREYLEFITGMLQHNLRNGMQIIDSKVAFLDSAVEESGREHLEPIDEWTSKLLDLSQTISLVTDVVTSPSAETLRAVNVTRAVRDRVAALEADHDVTVTVDVPPEQFVVANDLLVELLDSLLHNAIEHNDTDHPEITVEGRSTEAGIEIRIADDGPGMSEELKRSVSNRQVGTSQTAGGFGLYFVSLMMDFYGGDLWFEDNDPRGAVAVLQFEKA